MIDEIIRNLPAILQLGGASALCILCVYMYAIEHKDKIKLALTLEKAQLDRVTDSKEYVVTYNAISKEIHETLGDMCKEIADMRVEIVRLQERRS